MADAQLRAVITAEDRASKVIADVSKRLDSIGDTVTSVGKKMSVGLTAPILAIAAGAAKVAMNLDDVRDSMALMSGATGEGLEELNRSFSKVFSTFPADAQEVADVIGTLAARLGLDGERLDELSVKMLRFSKVTGVDAKQAVGLLTRVFGDWSVAWQDQTKVMDTLVGVAQISGIAVDQLAAKVVQFGAPLRQMGFSLQESAILMGKWEKEGVNTELVLGSLRIAMGEFARTNTPMREGLDATIKKIQELGPGAKSTALAMEVFGARAGPDMAAAILEGRFSLQEMMTILENFQPTVDRSMEATEGFSEKLQVLKNRAMLAAEPLGVALMDALTRLMPYLEKGIAFITIWIERFSELSPKTQTIILLIFGLIAAIGPALVIIGTLISSISAITTGFIAFAAAIGVTSIGLIAIIGTIGLVVAAIAGLAYAVIKIKAEYGSLKEFFRQTWDGIVIIFKEAIESIKRFALSPLEDKLNSVKNALSSIAHAARSLPVIGPIAGVASNLFGRASGGSVSPSRSFIVGEHGPEVFTPQSYGAISQGAGAGGITINFNNATFMGREGIAEQIGNDIMRILKRNAKL